MRKKLLRACLALALPLLFQITAQAQVFDPVCALFTITQNYGQPGDTICLDVRASVPSDLLTAQFAILWNPDDLTILLPFDYSNSVLNLTASNFNLNTMGTLKFSWFDQNVAGVPITPGGLLFRICFRINPGASGFLPVRFGALPFPLDPNLNYEAYIIDAPDLSLPQNAVLGGILVGGTPPNEPVVEMICSGSDHCQGPIAVGSVDLIMADPTAIYTYQWSGPNGFTATTQDLFNVGVGHYAVTITDAAGHANVAVAEVLMTADPACPVRSPTLSGAPLQLWPNPAVGHTVVKCPDADIQSLTVVSIGGRVWKKDYFRPTREARLDTRGLPGGLYQVMVQTEQGTQRVRLFVP